MMPGLLLQTGGRKYYLLLMALDLGLNWKPADHLFINTAAWYLYLQQEFVYDGDEGTLEPGDKTRREGIDFSARYQFNNWLICFYRY